MASKKNQRKSVLVASCVMAALIVGASTFAWFTSSDEVTNRLTASSNYGVSVTEDFTPPENWVPGQTVKKEVGVVNTGNVDAFVRMWLEGEMKLIKEDSAGKSVADFGAATITNVNDATLTAIKLSKKDEEGTYYRVLSDSDRKALQTGELAYSPSYTNGAGAVTKINSESFDPSGAGIYLFRRSYNLAGDGSIDTNTIEYSGYYYNGTDCYALQTKNDSTVSGGVEGKGSNVYVKGMTGAYGSDASTGFAAKAAAVKLFTASKIILSNSDLLWTYTASPTAASSPFGSTNPFFTVVQNNVSSTLAVNIELQNVGTGSTQWTYSDGEGNTNDTFYYNDDLEGGASASLLVKNVKLDDRTSQNDYIAFDFDLNVNLESIQVTKDSDGNESDQTVKDGWEAAAQNSVTARKGTATVTSGEITAIAWEEID